MTLLVATFVWNALLIMVYKVLEEYWEDVMGILLMGILAVFWIWCLVLMLTSKLAVKFLGCLLFGLRSVPGGCIKPRWGFAWYEMK